MFSELSGSDCVCHIDDTLFGKFLATITSDISSALFSLSSPTDILILFPYSVLLKTSVNHILLS